LREKDLDTELTAKSLFKAAKRGSLSNVRKNDFPGLLLEAEAPTTTAPRHRISENAYLSGEADE
jgi:hypothetical protein